MKARKKKIVDLIYLNDNKPESQLVKEYESRIKTWTDWLDIKQNDDNLIQDAYIEEQTEFYMVNNVLTHFISKRLDWINKSVADPDLRMKYLSVLTPFSQQGNIKRFLQHFFQLVEEEPNQDRLKFQFLNNSEREIKILWDIYKLTKTIECVTTLKKAADSSTPFPSVFSSYYIEEVLSTLNDVAELLIKICIKPLYQKSVIDNFPLEVFDAETILRRKEADEFLITDIVLEKYDYRNYLFYIYFRPSIKAIYQDEEISFKFNYLDYEIIRQEFLTEWLSVRLNSNPKKHEIFEQYIYSNKTFNQVIESNPKMELVLLKQLPKNVFDDLIASVNNVVNRKDQAGIDPMSESIGTFAKQFKIFNQALTFAHQSIKSLRKMISKSKKIEPFDFEVEEKMKPKAKPVELLENLLKKKEIAFPYFCEQNSKFSKQHAFFKTKMSTDYKPFVSIVSEHLVNISESKLIKRRTPRHEWSTPYIIEEPGENSNISYLLIVGADVRSNPLSMGYSSGPEEKYNFNPYFVLGCQTKIMGMGTPTEERTARGKVYFVYDFSNPQVIKKALKLLDHVAVKKKKKSKLY